MNVDFRQRRRDPDGQAHRRGRRAACEPPRLVALVEQGGWGQGFVYCETIETFLSRMFRCSGLSGWVGVGVEGWGWRRVTVVVVRDCDC